MVDRFRTFVFQPEEKARERRSTRGFSSILESVSHSDKGREKEQHQERSHSASRRRPFSSFFDTQDKSLISFESQVSIDGDLSLFLQINDPASFCFVSFRAAFLLLFLDLGLIERF